MFTCFDKVRFLSVACPVYAVYLEKQYVELQNTWKFRGTVNYSSFQQLKIAGLLSSYAIQCAVFKGFKGLLASIKIPVSWCSLLVALFFLPEEIWLLERDKQSISTFTGNPKISLKGFGISLKLGYIAYQNPCSFTTHQDWLTKGTAIH